MANGLCRQAKCNEKLMFASNGTREPVAGIRPGMKYRELKEYYNHKEYVRGLIQPAAGLTLAMRLFPRC